MKLENLKTVKQISETCSVFTEAALRFMIFNAENNGLNRALVRVGRRVLIDVPEFERWLEAGRVAGSETGQIRKAG